MLTGHGVSTRQAATLTGLVRSTVTRRCNAATAQEWAGLPMVGRSERISALLGKMTPGELLNA